MTWLINFLNSSLGQKLLMSLTGLFLCSFLLVHLAGNLQLLAGDGGVSFNAYAAFMTSNPLIKFISYGLYFFILLHAVKGFALAFSNRKARGPQGYKVQSGGKAPNKFISNNMALWGLIIFAFIGLHMSQFWYRMKFGEMPMQGEYKDLYTIVAEAFQQEWVVAVYVLSLVALSLHLIHGFQSAFQTLGVNHKKYTPVIKIVGLVFSIVIPLGYMVLPIYFLMMA